MESQTLLVEELLKTLKSGYLMTADQLTARFKKSIESAKKNMEEKYEQERNEHRDGYINRYNRKLRRILALEEYMPFVETGVMTPVDVIKEVNKKFD